MTPTRKRARWLAYLAVLGPGILAASAGNDAGGIVAYASAGSAYGYRLLWLLLFLTFALVVVQEMCARMGAVTGKGLSDLIRENFGVRWTLLAMGVLLIANAFITMSEFAGIASALAVFGIPGVISVPVVALLIWFLIVRGDYGIIEKALLVVAALFLVYPLAAFLLPGIPWPHVMKMMFVPSGKWISADPRFVLTAIAVIGTTVAPWMQFYVQSSVVDKGVRTQDLHLQRADIFAGSISADIVAFFIIVVTATAFMGSPRELNTAAEAASALQPVIGHAATGLFAIGLLGASILGAVAVPLTTAYTVCEAFGWERGVGNKFRQAPMFFGLYTGLLILGSLVVMVLPERVYFSAIVRAQQVNGIITPIILIFILLLVNNRRLMGEHTNSRAYNIIAWGTVGMVILFVIAWLVTELLPGLIGAFV